MYQLIALAYPVEGLPGKHPFMNCLLVSSTGRMFGGPEWLKREMWDLQAAIAEGVMSTTTAAVYPGRPGPDWERLWIMDPKVHQMLQTLLAERIKLVIRKETREMPVYLLKVGKDGAKFNGHGEAFQRMRFLDNDGKVKPASELPPPADGSFAFLANNIMEVQNASMENFANTLFGLDGRPVLDRTGLTGRYDFHYSGAPAPLSVEKIGETLSNLKRDAVKAMGLELEESRANYDVWVIVSAERPSEN
jgi:uncharacterized protein (TIGR03435 family)